MEWNASKAHSSWEMNLIQMYLPESFVFSKTCRIEDEKNMPATKAALHQRWGEIMVELKYLAH